jgi:hypothetical protein
MVPLRPILISLLLTGAGISYVEFGPGKAQIERLFDLQQHLSSCATDQVNQTLEMLDRAQRGQTVGVPLPNCDPTEPLAGWGLSGNLTSSSSTGRQQGSVGEGLQGEATAGPAAGIAPRQEAILPREGNGYPWQAVASLGAVILVLAGVVLFLALRLRSVLRANPPSSIRVVRVVCCPRCRVRIAAAERVGTCPVCGFPGLPPPDTLSFARG